MISHSLKNRTALIGYPRTLAWGIAVWFVCASCSGGADRPHSGNQASATASNQASIPSPSPSPSPTVAPLKTPERVASGKVTESRGTWNSVVQRIMYVSSADNTRQPMMFYKPNLNEPRPLLVALHSWSEGYRQSESVIYSEWAIANDWIFIHPHFRGPNVKPEATGSDLVIGDVLSAIDYAKANAQVDESRIYAVGWSGGGHLGLLLAGRAPEIWAGVSAWVPVSDLNAWYEESRRLRTKYVSHIEASCGGRPTGDTPAARECRKRSPLSYLERARAVPIDLNHGINDGRNNADPVPISHSLRAFNLLAEPRDHFSEEEIDFFTRQSQVPGSLRSETTTDPDYGGLKILYRRQSGNARITVFDGAHDKNTEAAFKWLNKQRRK
ncbi:MAG TPA: prolyl oligopeptidase family serine peptidase [Pyrinomonadaceae bacterium]